MSTAEPQYIAALLERISRLITTGGHTGGLKPVQWEALRYLAKANRFSNTAAALTLYLGLTKGTVSQTLMTLQSKGLIRKASDEKDRRAARLSLTPEGLQLLASDPLKTLESALLGLPNEVQQDLGKGLTDLLAIQLKARNRQPFGQCRNCRYFARNHPEGGPHRCLLVEEKLSATEGDKICVEQSPMLSVINR